MSVDLMDNVPDFTNTRFVCARRCVPSSLDKIFHMVKMALAGCRPRFDPVSDGNDHKCVGCFFSMHSIHRIEAFKFTAFVGFGQIKEAPY